MHTQRKSFVLNNLDFQSSTDRCIPVDEALAKSVGLWVETLAELAIGSRRFETDPLHSDEDPEVNIVASL